MPEPELLEGNNPETVEMTINSVSVTADSFEPDIEIYEEV